MNRFLIFLISVFATTTARAADIATTFAFSPDLSLEGNPLMADIGFEGIIVVNLFVVVATSLLTYYWWRHPVEFLLPQDPDDFITFASMNYSGRRTSARQLLFAVLFKLPKNWRMGVQLLGLALPVCLVVGSGMAVFSWFAVHEWHLPWYRSAYFRTHFVFPYGLLLLLYVAAAVLYFKIEHTRSKHHFKKVQESAVVDVYGKHTE